MHVPLRAHFPAQSVWASVRTDRCVRVRNRGWRSRCAQVGSAPPERCFLRRICSEPGKAPGCVFGRGGPQCAGFGSACPLLALTDPPPLTDARETLCKSIARRHCDGRLPPGDAPPRCYLIWGGMKGSGRFLGAMARRPLRTRTNVEIGRQAENIDRNDLELRAPT